MIKTQEYTINLGPQHPSTHGVFRMILKLDGEVVTDVVPVLGYLHRGIEKLAEDRTYPQFIPYTDRLDYLASMSNNIAYVQTVEKLMGIEVPERAEYIRVIMAELQRIASHMMFVGVMSMDLGGFTGFLYVWRDRERIYDLFSMASGARMTYNYMRIGGVANDLPEEFFPAVNSLLDDMPALIDEYNGLITGNEIFQARTKNIGIVTPEQAVNYGFSGPMLRSSGVSYDLRRDEPYGIYDRFKFDVPVGEKGDTFDRYVQRIKEMEESVKIIRQALAEMPEGPVMAKVPKVIKPPKGEAFHQVENPRGKLGFYVVSDGSPKPYRIHVKRPTFINLAILPELLKGWKVADVVAIFASFDLVLGEVDC